MRVQSFRATAAAPARSRSPRLAGWLAAGCAAMLLAALAAGCGGSSSTKSATTTQAAAGAKPAAKPAAPPSAKPGAGKEGCMQVPAALSHRILARVILENASIRKLRAAAAAATPGYYYVSGVIAGAGTKGLLATWVTKGLSTGKIIYSVDSNAALVSDYGAAANLDDTLNIDAPAAYRSRVCVAGKRAPQGVAAPLSGRGAPSGQ